MSTPEPAHPRTLTREVAVAAVILALLHAVVFALLISARSRSCC
jgi:uncharacterized protein YhhL (DUF1145 family)